MNLLEWTRTFSYELRDRMLERHYRRIDLAKEACVTPSTITKLLGAHQTPELYTINNLSAALTVSMEDLTNFHDRID